MPMMGNIPVYIRVNGTASDNEDEGVAGFYLVMVDRDLEPELHASAALDAFHEHIGISTLDDFSISALDEDGLPLEEPEDQDSHELGDRAEFCGKVDPADLPFEDEVAG